MMPVSINRSASFAVTAGKIFAFFPALLAVVPCLGAQQQITDAGLGHGPVQIVISNTGIATIYVGDKPLAVASGLTFIPNVAHAIGAPSSKEGDEPKPLPLPTPPAPTPSPSPGGLGSCVPRPCLIVYPFATGSNALLQILPDIPPLADSPTPRQEPVAAAEAPAGDTHVREPADIKLFFVDKPTEPFRELGRVSASKYGTLGRSRKREVIDEELKSKAAELGGDAVINITEDFASVSGVVISFQKK